MSTIKPIEAKTAEVAREISDIIKGRATRYQYLRPDGLNIENYVGANTKPAYQYVRESEPINAQLTKRPGVGEIIDFYAG